MLFLVFGGSASGKSSIAQALRGRIDDLAIHDFDEVGVPAGATVEWRLATNAVWVERALAYQATGIDLLLTGQTSPSELSTTPRAVDLDAVRACLVDCDDETRSARLKTRGGDRDELIARQLRWSAALRREAGFVLDTSRGSVADAAAELARWIARERAALGR